MNRVTNGSSARAMLATINATGRSLAAASERASSGKQITRPSDGPAQVLTALDYRGQLRRNEQLGRNAIDARNWLDTADTVMMHSVERLNRARTLVVGGVNGATDAQGREAYANELRAIAEELSATANTRHLGRPIFGGTSDGTSAYDGSTYVGDAGAVTRTIAPGVAVQVNATGPQVFGEANDAEPLEGNVFQMLNAIASALESGDLETASAGITALDTAQRRIEGVQIQMGTRSLQVEQVTSRNAENDIELKSALAEVEDVDYAEAIIEMRSQEMAYQAALSVTAKVIQPTLLDFLR